MNICKCCGKPIEGEKVMNPDVYGNGYHHFCLINKEFREKQRQIYNKGKADAFKWIPVSERLPEDGTWNLFTDGNMVSVERYKADAMDHFYPIGRWFSLDEAIAWMPLPEPYQTESEEEE